MSDTAPSQAELTLLKHLWSAGPQSAREAHDALAPLTGWTPSTTRTYLMRMVQKGLVEKGEVHGLAVFSAAVAKVEMMGRMIRDFTANVLELKGPVPGTALVNTDLLSDEEAEALLKLLDGEGAQ